MQSHDRRILTLDGFRALAIIMVIAFHYFSRWTTPLHSENLYPYGDALASAFGYGYLGVELFFIISGFVIAMTLATCSTVQEFAIKRFARLWPALLICSLLTFAVGYFLPLDAFPVKPMDFIPSLTLVNPYIMNKIFGSHTYWIDGAYWSLFIEASFYVWAAALFFVFRGRLLIAFFVLLNISILGAVLTPLRFRGLFEMLLLPEYLYWFCAGIGFYYVFNRRELKLASLLIAESAFLAIGKPMIDLKFGAALLGCLFFTMFICFVVRPRLVSAFAWKPVAIIGVVSYSLYLLHQQIGVALIYHLAGDARGPHTIVVALAVIALLTGLALLIYHYWEVPAKRMILALNAKALSDRAHHVATARRTHGLAPRRST